LALRKLKDVFRRFLQPAVLDRHVLALDVASFAKPLAERGPRARCGFGRPGVDEPDHRVRRLLRTRRERPRHRAAQPTNKLPSFDHSIT
jgi:hypothetical protein